MMGTSDSLLAPSLPWQLAQVSSTAPISADALTLTIESQQGNAPKPT
jgi:hypothetical protein